MAAALTDLEYLTLCVWSSQISMAPMVQFLFPFLLANFIGFSMAQQGPFMPNTIILPVTKDFVTLQYVTQVSVGAPMSPVKLAVDLAGPFFWINCASASLSSFHHSIQSCTLQCSIAKPNSCISPAGNDMNTCTLQPGNTITGMDARGELAENIMAFEVTDGLKTSSLASFPHFLFSCAPTSLLEGLGSGVEGMLGLGNTRISLPAQVARTFGFARKFSLCLSASNGVILSGESPHGEMSRSLLYTPLNFYEGNKSQGYYIKVKSIKINGKKLSINKSLLGVNQGGHGGTKISTTVAYTTMESTLYNTFIEAYIKAATSMNMTKVSSMAPFGVCFSSKGVESTRAGPKVPTIDLVLQSEMVRWRIHGGNSMVHVSDEVMCLGFLDGGSSPKASMVIGGHQLEDNFLEFNLETSMLGFSSYLGQRSCSNLRSNSMSREVF